MLITKSLSLRALLASTWRSVASYLRGWRDEWRSDANHSADAIAECGEYPGRRTRRTTAFVTFPYRDPVHSRHIWWSTSRGMWACRLSDASGTASDLSPVIYGQDRMKLVAYLERLERFEKANPTVR